MKKLITTLTLSIATLVSFSQSQNWWRTNGNTPASTDVFGTTNAQPINIVTNNVLKMVLDANGNLRLVNFAGTGTRVVTSDANGNLLALPQGTTGQFLSNNGTWQSLPTSATTWSVNGAHLFSTNTGNVNINSNFIFGNSGTFKNNAWAGTGNRFLQTDANGNVTPFANGTTGQYLDGTGAWLNLPNALSSFSTTGNKIYLAPTMSLGIGTANPAYILDVAGDARVQNNLYVGGGIIITDRVNAAETVTASMVRADTMRTPVLIGNTRVTGDINSIANMTVMAVDVATLTAAGDVTANSKLTVQGNATFNGALRSTALGGAGSGALYADSLGNLYRGAPSGACVITAPQWSWGGDDFLPFSGVGGSVNDAVVGTCNNYDFILKANNAPSQWLKTDGKIGFGTATPSEKFHFTGGNLRVDDRIVIGAAAPTGVNFHVVAASDNIAGCFISNHTVDNLINTKIIVNRKLTKALAILSIAPGVGQEILKITGDGSTVINTVLNPNDNAFVLKSTDPNNLFSSVDNFVVKANGRTAIGSLTAPEDLLQVGNGLTKVVMGSAAGVGLNYGTAYIGLNASRQQGPGTWATASDGYNNGGSAIFGDVNGNIIFSTIASTGNSTQNLTDGNIVTKSKLILSTNGGAIINTNGLALNTNAFEIKDNATTNTNFIVKNSGYTEINVYSPNGMPQPPGGSPRAFAIIDKLANKDLFVVNASGKIYSREVEISLQSTFPDYVFAKDYKLKPLNEVEAYIAKNKHLPNFEKGEYYEKNGVNVTDILLKQQQTIEELMLYNIQLEKRLKALEEKK